MVMAVIFSGVVVVAVVGILLGYRDYQRHVNQLEDEMAAEEAKWRATVQQMIDALYVAEEKIDGANALLDKLKKLQSLPPKEPNPPADTIGGN